MSKAGSRKVPAVKVTPAGPAWSLLNPDNAKVTHAADSPSGPSTKPKSRFQPPSDKHRLPPRPDALPKVQGRAAENQRPVASVSAPVAKTQIIPIARPRPIQVICNPKEIIFHIPFDRKKDWMDALRLRTGSAALDSLGFENWRVQFQLPKDTAYALQGNEQETNPTQMWVDHFQYGHTVPVPRLAMACGKGLEGFTYLEGNRDVMYTCLGFLETDWDLKQTNQYDYDFRPFRLVREASITLSCYKAKKRHGKVTAFNFRIAFSQHWKGPLPKHWQRQAT